MSKKVPENELNKNEVSCMDEENFNKYLNEIINSDKKNTETEEKTEDKVDENLNISKGENSDDENKVFKSFKTKEEFQAEIDRIINSRFRDYKQTKSKYNDLIDDIKCLYETDDEDEALKNLKEHLADEGARGFDNDVQKYKKHNDMYKKAKKYDELMQQNQNESDKKMSDEKSQTDNIMNIRTKLLEEEKAIQSKDNTFSLEKALDDEEFKNNLLKSGSVFYAYLSIAKKPQNLRTFKEAGVENPSGGKVKRAISDLSDDDFEAYIKKIEGNF